jgi:hypothetical protein
MLTVIATIVVASCTKTNEPINNKTPLLSESDKKMRSVVYETSYGLLRFENRDALDNVCSELGNQTIDYWTAWENTLTFSSLRRKLIETPDFPNKLRTFDDDLLKTLLNENGMFQVGEIIYKISYDDGLVWSLNCNCTLSDYQKLINEEWDASKMNRFYINDDVDIYDKAETGIVGYDRKYRGLFGSDKKFSDNVTHSMTIPNTNPVQTGDFEFRADCKTSYQNAGVYKSVTAKMKYYSQQIFNAGDQFCICYGNLTTTTITMNANWNFDPKGPQAPIINTNFVQTLTDSKNDIRPYNGTRQCDGFINASFTYVDKGIIAPITNRTVSLPKNNF